MTFNAKHKKSSQAIRSLRRRGDPYGNPRLRASQVAALTCHRHVIHSRSLRFPRWICKSNQPTSGGLIAFGDPYGNRTHVTAVKGRCLNRLTNGPGSGNLIRTDDIPGMNRLLYQLSYAAMWSNDLGTAETSFLIISMRPLFVKKFFRIFLFSWAFPRKNPAKAPP